jgi:hypothetical protein
VTYAGEALKKEYQTLCNASLGLLGQNDGDLRNRNAGRNDRNGRAELRIAELRDRYFVSVTKVKDQSSQPDEETRNEGADKERE